MSSQEHGDDKENSNERWLVSYADFITLMFAFFAVLYATSVKDVEKTKEFQESIKRYLIKAGAFGESGGQMNQGQKNNSAIEPPIQTFNPAKPEAAKALDEVEAFFEDKVNKLDRKKFLLDMAADDWGVRLTIPSNVIFAPGSDKFRPEAVPFITNLSALIAKTKRKILIEGHVIENEKGPYKSTWEFASARAVNMLRFIQTKQNMKSSQLATASLGDSRPLFQNEKRSLNSRLEIILLNDDLDF